MISPLPAIVVLVLFAVVSLLLLVVRIRYFRGSRFLSICPRVTESEGVVEARTSLVALCLSLTLLHRVVTIDRNRKRIEIRRRICWLFARRQVIPFDHIKKILYAYEDWSLTSALDITGDTLDCYAVRLLLHGDEDPVHLFYFLGEGEFQRGELILGESWLPDWWFWHERLMDTSGSQEAASKQFLERLEEYTGAPVAPG